MLYLYEYLNIHEEGFYCKPACLPALYFQEDVFLLLLLFISLLNRVLIYVEIGIFKRHSRYS